MKFKFEVRKTTKKEKVQGIITLIVIILAVFVIKKVI